MKIFQRLFVIVMVPLLAFFASGVGIHTHFCRGELVTVSVFMPATGCEMQSQPQVICEAPTTEADCGTNGQVKKANCCEDHSDFFQLPTFSKTITAALPTFFVAAIVPSNNAISLAPQMVFQPATPPHGPPLAPTGKQIRITIQSFLC